MKEVLKGYIEENEDLSIRSQCELLVAKSKYSVL